MIVHIDFLYTYIFSSNCLNVCSESHAVLLAFFEHGLDSDNIVPAVPHILMELRWHDPIVVAIHQQLAHFGFPQHMLSYEQTHRQKCTKHENSKCCKDNLPRQGAPTENVT